MAEQEETRNLLLMKKNQIAMMRLRGYEIGKADSNLEDMNTEEFTEYIENMKSNVFVKKMLKHIKEKSVVNVLSETRGLMSYHYAKEGEEEKTCAVVYITRKEDGRIKKDFTNALVPVLINFYTDMIFISDRGLTPDSLNIINNVPAKDRGAPRYTWLFRDEEFYTNPLAHTLSPKYGLLSKEDAMEFRKLYANPLLISSEDPAVKLPGWKINSVVGILRDISGVDSIVKEMVSKRLVVRSQVVTGIVG